MTKPLSKHAYKRLVISPGEPAGIGPELCLSLISTKWVDRIIVIADPNMLKERAKKLKINVKFSEYGRNSSPGELIVLPIELQTKVKCGKPDPNNAHYILDGLKRAVDGCLNNEFSALITGPIQKNIINDAGIPFTGHTEYIAKLVGEEIPVMLLTNERLRVALVTTHLPISKVPEAINSKKIESIIKIIHKDLIAKFKIENPEIFVCGLNPHAGENGYLGKEDIEIISPALRKCKSLGIKVVGPLPADTAFTPAAGNPDAILAMYHDQGLPVIKYAGFGNIVNVTLGLPIIRTSVDHGTALDIAGKGIANPGSLLSAIKLADNLSSK